MSAQTFTFEGETFRSDDWSACSTVRAWLWRKVHEFCVVDQNYAATGYDSDRRMRCTAILLPDCWPFFVGFDDGKSFRSWEGHDLPIEVALILWELAWETPKPLGAIDCLVRALKPWHRTMHELDQRKPNRYPVAWTCPTCAAGPQRPCVSKSGKPYHPDKFIHRARIAVSAREA